MADQSSLAKLLPDAETLVTWGALDTFLEWAKVPVHTWACVATALGEPDLDELPVIAALPNHDVVNAILLIEPSIMQKTRINLLINAIRASMDQPVVDLWSGTAKSADTKAPGPAGGTATQGDAVVSTSPDQGQAAVVADITLKVNHYFDQGSRLQVKPADPDTLQTMRHRWLVVNTLPPGPQINLSDNQLSVLFRLGGVNHNLLAFDMGVWGPFGVRRERNMMVTAHVLNAQGVYVPKEISGAQCLDDWLEAWAFATTGFVMGRVVERGVADAYRDHFKNICTNYPQSWWVCCQAEWEFRFEFAVEEERRQREFHTSQPALSAYAPDMPWNSVLLAGVKGLEAMQYWEDRLKEKARKWQASPEAASRPSWVHRQAALFTPATPSAATAVAGASVTVSQPVSGTQSAPGTGRRQRKRQWAAVMAHGGAASSQQPHTSEPRAVAPRTQGTSTDARALADPGLRRSDGRWTKDEDNVDICYAYNRNPDGCERQCPRRMSHVCEWCRDRHRAIECPVHPNWMPPPTTGKGGGRQGKSRR